MSKTFENAALKFQHHQGGLLREGDTGVNCKNFVSVGRSKNPPNQAHSHHIVIEEVKERRLGTREPAEHYHMMTISFSEGLKGGDQKQDVQEKSRLHVIPSSFCQAVTSNSTKSHEPCCKTGSLPLLPPQPKPVIPSRAPYLYKELELLELCKGTYQSLLVFSTILKPRSIHTCRTEKKNKSFSPMDRPKLSGLSNKIILRLKTIQPQARKIFLL